MQVNTQNVEAMSCYTYFVAIGVFVMHNTGFAIEANNQSAQ